MALYQPAEDSWLLESQVRKFAKNKTVLDMGSGSGIQAKAAISSSAKLVLAADINPLAITHLKSLKIPTIKSDLFSNIKEFFDLIIFNPPYLPEDPREPKDSQLATTGGKLGDEIILKFLKQAPKHLNKEGKILLLVSSLTPLDRIKALNFKFKSLSKKKIFQETLEVLEIEGR
jgi:release factor glutamine methyltransferase